MKMVNVLFSKLALKQLERTPIEIKETVYEWILQIEETGIEYTRKFGGKGLHDEPLKGELKGLRSIRLNRSWRLYYNDLGGIPQIIFIERIDKHIY